MVTKLRIGVVSAVANTRARHIPGFRALDGIQLAEVVNHISESTRRVADEFGIAERYDPWQQLSEVRQRLMIACT